MEWNRFSYWVVLVALISVVITEVRCMPWSKTNARKDALVAKLFGAEAHSGDISQTLTLLEEYKEFLDPQSQKEIDSFIGFCKHDPSPRCDNFPDFYTTPGMGWARSKLVDPTLYECRRNNFKRCKEQLMTEFKEKTQGLSEEQLKYKKLFDDYLVSDMIKRQGLTDLGSKTRLSYWSFDPSDLEGAMKTLFKRNPQLKYASIRPIQSKFRTFKLAMTVPLADMCDSFAKPAMDVVNRIRDAVQYIPNVEEILDESVGDWNVVVSICKYLYKDVETEENAMRDLRGEATAKKYQERLEAERKQGSRV